MNELFFRALLKIASSSEKCRTYVGVPHSRDIAVGEDMRRSFELSLVGWHLRPSIEGAHKKFAGNTFINLTKIFLKRIMFGTIL